jgi:hypothetical protein
MRRHLCLLLGLLGLVLNTPTHADPSLEYAVKAAYLPKFVPFIAWPDSVFSSPAAPITICVTGQDLFGGKLDQAANALKSGEHPITVHHLSAGDSVDGCHLIFLGAAQVAAAEQVLDETKDRPFVTITDSGMPVHGVISFVIDANHVRFDIDNAEAAKRGLTISSKLLNLAHAVRQRGAP